MQSIYKTHMFQSMRSRMAYMMSYMKCVVIPQFGFNGILFVSSSGLNVVRIQVKSTISVISLILGPVLKP